MSRARLQVKHQAAYDLAVLKLAQDEHERAAANLVWMLRTLPVDSCGRVLKRDMRHVQEAAEKLAGMLGISSGKMTVIKGDFNER